MFENVLGPDAEWVLRKLSRWDFVRTCYLAGGTGCALQIGHRRSEDFDFFSTSGFDPFAIQNAIRNLGRFVTDYTDSGTLTGRLDGVRVSLFHYAYPLLGETVEGAGVRIGSLLDIGCMKIDAVSARGAKRDFIDLRFILETLGIGLKDLMPDFERKYGSDGFNLHHVLKSLVYFDDADREPDPVMLTEFSWPAAKRFFVESVKALAAFSRRT